MALIDSISVALRATTKNFVKGMGKAKRAVGGLVSGLGSLKGLLVGGLLAAGFVKLGRDALRAVDNMAKLSRRTGVAIENLQGLELAASQAGVSMDLFRRGLGRMIANIGMAAQGTGEAVLGFEAMGIAVDELAKKSADEQIKDISEALSKMTNATERTTAAYRVFGRTSLDMLNLLVMGREQFDRFQREAEELGLTFNSFEAERIEDTVDALDKMKRVFAGIRDQIAIGLAPLMTHLVDQFLDWMKSVGGASGAADVFVKAFIDAFEFIGKAFAQFTADSLAGFSKIATKLAKFSVPRMQDAADALTDAAEAARVAKFRIGLQFRDMRRELDRIQGLPAPPPRAAPPAPQMGGGALALAPGARLGGLAAREQLQVLQQIRDDISRLANRNGGLP